MRCAAEAEVVVSINEGRWPEAISPDLRRHVLSCADCREVTEVAAALLDDRLGDEPQVEVPSAASVWWRMQMRLRREQWIEATRRVSRVHTLIVLATIAFFAANALPLVQSGLISLAATKWAAIAGIALPAIALTVVLYTPAALYVAVKRE